MPIDLTFFGDFTSPASYLTEVALRKMMSRDAISVDWRAAPVGVGTVPDALSRSPLAEHTQLAADLGIELRLPGFAPSTGKAHEAARVVRARSMEEALRLSLYQAYWTEGRDIGRIDVLQAVAAEVGLDPLDMKIALDIDRYRADVLNDFDVARALGIDELPVVFVGKGSGATILKGAQSPALLADAVRAAGLASGTYASDGPAL